MLVILKYLSSKQISLNGVKFFVRTTQHKLEKWDAVQYGSEKIYAALWAKVR